MICACGHDQSRHVQNKTWCAASTCQCWRYEPSATAVAQPEPQETTMAKTKKGKKSKMKYDPQTVSDAITTWQSRERPARVSKVVVPFTGSSYAPGGAGTGWPQTPPPLPVKVNKRYTESDSFTKADDLEYALRMINSEHFAFIPDEVLSYPEIKAKVIQVIQEALDDARAKQFEIGSVVRFANVDSDDQGVVVSVDTSRKRPYRVQVVDGLGSLHYWCAAEELINA